MKKSSLKAALACSFILAACSTSPQGRKQIIVPQPVSKAYSEADMRIQLATASSVSTPCIGIECTRNQAFEQQVKSTGYRLALAAYDTYPDLVKRVSEFQFEVAAKSEPGSTSNAAGKIVIYRGVQELEFDEAGVAFLIAREMGHVIGQHHEENSGTKILLSVAVGVLFPALHLFNGTAQLAQATQATQATGAATLGTTVASTATSYVGSKAILAGLKPDQLNEADAIALKLLEREGWHLHDVASILDKSEEIKGGSAWTEDLRISIARLRVLDAANQSIDLTQQPIALHVQRECSADTSTETPEEIIDAEQIASSDVPVMAAELTPAPIETNAPTSTVAETPSPESTGTTTPEPEKIADLPEADQPDIEPQPSIKLQPTRALQRKASAVKNPGLAKPLKQKPSVLAAAKKTPRGKVVKTQKPPPHPKTAKPTKTAKPGNKPVPHKAKPKPAH